MFNNKGGHISILSGPVKIENVQKILRNRNRII